MGGLYVASGHLWSVAALFFGLWLIPMGWLVVHSRWLPRPLGWTLVVGGVGYLVSAFVSYLFPSADVVSNLLTVPATVGELGITGFLIFARPTWKRVPETRTAAHRSPV